MIGTLIVSWYVYTVFVWPYESAIRTAGVIRGCRAPEDAEALIKRDIAREVEALGQRSPHIPNRDPVNRIGSTS